MSRHVAAVAGAALVGLLGAVFVGAGPAAAARTTGWATWTPITGSSNDYATTMQLPALGFPKATVATDSRANVQLPSGASTFLGGAADSTPTDVGIKYGSSRGMPYLNLRPKADNASSPSRTTYTFDTPTPDTGWAFVLGDIDADQVQIAAKDPAGTALTPAQIDQWFQSVFNYASSTPGADAPTWDAATSTLTGNAGAVDTNGASGWFEPNIAISSLTLTFTQRSGFPVYQTWFASVARTISGTVTDVSAGAGSCPVQDAVIHLIGPGGQELATTHPAGDGTYSFGQYATQPGYIVRIDRPDGCAVLGAVQHTVNTSAADASADFLLRQVIPQPVSGTVTAQDGTPVAGVEITLTPPGGGTPTVVTTDASGQYLFDDNAEVAGYAVAVTGIPDGYQVSGVASRSFDILPGTPVTGQDFTLVEQPSVSGVVTGGDGPLGGVTITLTPSGGGTPVSTTTRGDGSYVFDHVPAGDYDLAVTPPAGYHPAPPRTGVTVAGVNVTGQDFALTRPGTLGGAVSDISTSSAPEPISAAIITITGPGVDQTLHTDADGSYFLDNLDPGDYTITLTVPDSYTAAGTTSHSVTITAAGENRGGQDFTIAHASPPPSSTPPSTPPGNTSGDGITPPLTGSSSSVPSSPASELAATGVPLASLLGSAVILVAAGSGLAGLASRRRQPRRS